MQQTANPATATAVPERQADPGTPTRAEGAPASLDAAYRSSHPPDRGGRRVWVAALAIAFTAHAAVLYAVVREAEASLAGGGGQVVDAISVTMVNSNVLESRDPERTQPAPAAAAASVENTDGAPESTAAAATTEQREAMKEQPEEPKQRPVDEPVREADAVLEVPRETRQQQKQESAAPAAGGAASRSDAASDAKTSAPAAASPGAVREYARYVVQALAKEKPKGTGVVGTTLVRFVIAGDGGLASAEVLKSSGTPKLDELALGVVHHVKFPRPPAGMTPLQLTFDIPYHFR
jgi:TonB family protein